MAKKATISKAKYDKTHMKQYLLKFHIVNDADIIEKLDSLESKQGYIRHLIRNDIKNCSSVPDYENSSSVPDFENCSSVPDLKEGIV